jgi:hypothetical protein
MQRPSEMSSRAATYATASMRAEPVVPAGIIPQRMSFKCGPVLRPRGTGPVVDWMAAGSVGDAKYSLISGSDFGILLAGATVLSLMQFAVGLGMATAVNRLQGAIWPMPRTEEELQRKRASYAGHLALFVPLISMAYVLTIARSHRRRTRPGGTRIWVCGTSTISWFGGWWPSAGHRQSNRIATSPNSWAPSRSSWDSRGAPATVSGKRHTCWGTTSSTRV